MPGHCAPASPGRWSRSPAAVGRSVRWIAPPTGRRPVASGSSAARGRADAGPARLLPWGVPFRGETWQ